MKKQIHPSFRSVALATALFLTFISPFAQSADIFGPPGTVDYQGSVLDGNGLPLAPDVAANYEMQFRIYDAQSGGTLVWAEKQLATVKGGKFSVRLGEGSPILVAGGAAEGAVAQNNLALAFEGKERYLGVTVVIGGQTPGEIQPRLAFLASPFSYIAGRAMVAQSVTQPAGSPPSSLNIGSVSYGNQVMSATGIISSSAHTVLVNGVAGSVDTTLPGGVPALNHQLLITKKDTTMNKVVVRPPSGGTINGEADKLVYLKVRGESITIQNVGGNDWWIVSESRDKTPIGTIISYATNNIPAGYIACDGAAPNRSEYPELSAALGTTWGSPSPTTFRVPDLRGAFLRGKDGGRLAGTWQGDELGSHTHGVNDSGHKHENTVSAAAGSIGYRGADSGGSYNVYAPSHADGYSTNFINPPTVSIANASATTGITIQTTGGAETRPENYSVNYCIKY